MQTYRILYYLSTGLFTALMLFSAGNYFFNTEAIASLFDGFGYPSYIMLPLGAAKVLGLIALWFFNGHTLKEWAYAGFFFNIVLAFFAHYMIGDGEHTGAVVAFILWVGSYLSYKKLY